MRSGGQVQVDRVGTYHEDHGVQSNGFESLSGSYSIPKRTVRVQGYRSTRKSTSFLRLRLATDVIQFTYINGAFAPAPDDIVGNLFKVCWVNSERTVLTLQCFGTEGHLIVNYS